MVTLAPVVSNRSFMSEDDFLAVRDDDRRVELIAGELIEMPAAGGRHGYLGSRFVAHLTFFVEDRQLGRVYEGQTGFVVIESPRTIVRPDVSFVQQDRVPPPEEEIGPLRLAPDLAVEIRSPSDSRREVALRAAFLLAVGVRMVWVADPDDLTVTVYRLGREPRVLTLADTLDGEDVLPGFSLPLAAIFR
jgi:Uma2 family endonuclease